MSEAGGTARSGPGTIRWAGVIGAIADWYDYSLDVYLAPVLAGLFFAFTGPLNATIAELFRPRAG